MIVLEIGTFILYTAVVLIVGFIGGCVTGIKCKK